MEVSRQTWTVPNIDREDRSRLWQRRNGRAFVDLCTRLVVQVVLLASTLWLLNSGEYLWAIPGVLLNAMVWSFMGWAGIGHEFFHGTVFGNRQVNKVLFRVCSTLTWSNYAFFEVSHWKHHKRTMWDDDPETNLECALAKRELPWLITIDLPGFVHRLRILCWNAAGRVPGRLADSFGSDPQALACLRRGARVVLISQSLLAAGFIWSGQLWLLLLFSLAAFTFTFPNRVLETAQHCGMERNVWDYRRNTRSVIIDPILGFLYANMNYHVEHHMFPGVPYYNLPELRRILVAKGELSVSAPRGFTQALRFSLIRETDVPVT